MAIDCLIRLEKRILKNKILALREQIKTAEENEINSIIQKISRIEKNINELINKYK